MFLRKGLVRCVVVTAPFVFCALAAQTRAQSQNEYTNSISPPFKTISIQPTKSDIHADRLVKTSPDKVTVTNLTTQELIRGAYDVNDDQIVGAPSWLNSQRYDVDAKVDKAAEGEDTSAEGEDSPAGETVQEREERMAQALLSNCFKLAAHREARLVPVYELVIAGDGPKLRESDPSRADSAFRVIQVESGRIVGREVPIATLARMLSDELGRPVLDSTHLGSHYDVTLQWPTAPESPKPAILAALQEQLGLKLVPQLMPKEFLVIDHVEMPSAE